MPSSFTANADYLVIARSPIVIEAGQEVCVGAPDRTWPGWVHVTAPDGRGTYIPAACLRRTGPMAAVVGERFDGTDLSVRLGDRVESLRETAGWHWCRNSSGQEGWVPGYLLGPA